MSNAVCDSSPLIHLAAIGRLYLLRDYYNSIIIPPAVWREVVDQGGDREGAKEITTPQDGLLLHHQRILHLSKPF